MRNFNIVIDTDPLKRFIWKLGPWASPESKRHWIFGIKVIAVVLFTVGAIKGMDRLWLKPEEIVCDENMRKFDAPPNELTTVRAAAWTCIHEKVGCYFLNGKIFSRFDNGDYHVMLRPMWPRDDHRTYSVVVAPDGELISVSGRYDCCFGSPKWWWPW